MVGHEGGDEEEEEEEEDEVRVEKKLRSDCNNAGVYVSSLFSATALPAVDRVI